MHLKFPSQVTAIIFVVIESCIKERKDKEEKEKEAHLTETG